MTETPTTPAPAATPASEPAAVTADTTPADAVPAPENAAPTGETPNDDGAAPADAPADTPPADAEDLLFDEPKPDEDGGDDGEKEGEDDEKPKDEDGEDGDAPVGVDVSALEIPDDMPIPEAMKADVDQLMKDLDDPALTSQEKAQKMIDAHVKSQKNSIDVWNDTKKEWRDETMNNEIVGGKNWESSQKAANAAIRAIWANEENGGSPELLESFQNDLKMLGLGNKLSFITGLVNLSKMIGEDNQGDSQGQGGAQELDMAERLYGKDGQGRG